MKILIALLVTGSLAFFGCQNEQTTAPSLPASTPEAIPVMISLKMVLAAFDEAKLPVTKAKIFDERTDPNSLLGRPGQYVEKMNFTDPRDKKRGSDCTVEVFRNHEEAGTRKAYIDAIGRASSIFGSYSYLHKNILVRISYGLVPSEADAYRKALESIDPSRPNV